MSNRVKNAVIPTSSFRVPNRVIRHVPRANSSTQSFCVIRKTTNLRRGFHLDTSRGNFPLPHSQTISRVLSFKLRRAPHLILLLSHFRIPFNSHAVVQQLVIAIREPALEIHIGEEFQIFLLGLRLLVTRVVDELFSQ